MINRRAFIVASAAGFVSATRAEASLPEGNVRIITPVPPGGSPDLVARLLAENLGTRWKRAVLVDNRPGADGIIAISALLEAKDPFALLLAPSGMVTVMPLLRDVPFNPQKDLRPVSVVAADYLAVVVPEASPVRSLKALTETAQSIPGSLNWFAVAGAPLLAFEAFVRRNLLQATYVPYKGGPDALRDLAESRIGVAVVPLTVAKPLAAAGRVRVIAVTNPERAPGLADILTAIESGYPELAVEGMLRSIRARIDDTATGRSHFGGCARRLERPYRQAHATQQWFAGQGRHARCLRTVPDRGALPLEVRGSATGKKLRLRFKLPWLALVHVNMRTCT